MATTISEISDDTREAKRKRLVELLSTGMTLEDASKNVGVTSRTVRYWRDADPGFAERIADAMCFTDDEVERVTLANCLDPDPAHNGLRMFWLKSRRPEVYREKIEQTCTTSITIDATVRQVATDELEAWRKQMTATLSSSQSALPTPPISSTPSS